MVRALLTAAAALALLGAAKPARVDYRLGIEPHASGPAVLDVEVRLRGDADGETRFVLPARLASDLAARGAKIEAAETTHRILRHGPEPGSPCAIG